MNVLNFGSLNVDYVYGVSHIAKPGETIKALSRNIFAGGKGLNQSVSMSRAGVDVFHAGCVGNESTLLLRTLQEENIDTEFVLALNADSGHTIIQVEDGGQNCIIVNGGANQKIPKSHVDIVIRRFAKNDLLVLQNEISNLAYIMEKAYTTGMQIIFNPSPYIDDIKKLPLYTVSYFVVNEDEGLKLFDAEVIEDIIPNASQQYPGCRVLLTMGENGAMYYENGAIIRQPAYTVKSVDSVAAGDTFLGYFVHGLTRDLPIDKTLDNAAIAAAITVTRHGAAMSIPRMEELKLAIERMQIAG